MKFLKVGEAAPSMVSMSWPGLAAVKKYRSTKACAHRHRDMHTGPRVRAGSTRTCTPHQRACVLTPRVVLARGGGRKDAQVHQRPAHIGAADSHAGTKDRPGQGWQLSRGAITTKS